MGKQLSTKHLWMHCSVDWSLCDTVQAPIEGRREVMTHASAASRDEHSAASDPLSLPEAAQGQSYVVSVVARMMKPTSSGLIGSLHQDAHVPCQHTSLWEARSPRESVE